MRVCEGHDDPREHCVEPFDSAGFHHTSIGAAVAYKQRATWQYPIFQYVLQKIADDIRQIHRLHEYGFAEEVWSSMGDGRGIMVNGASISDVYIPHPPRARAPPTDTAHAARDVGVLGGRVGVHEIFARMLHRRCIGQ